MTELVTLRRENTIVILSTEDEEAFLAKHVEWRDSEHVTHGKCIMIHLEDELKVKATTP